jgi:DNA ligase-associated metallophosphoesterase
VENEVEIRGHLFRIFPQKVMYWPAHRLLIVSDIHVGKAGHFRASGIAIPGHLSKNNYWRLVEVLEKCIVEEILFLGDLSHSRYNTEWDEFIDFLDQYPHIHRTLIRGNHDILEKEKYSAASFSVVEQKLIDGILFEHEKSENETAYYSISGHIHPGVRMLGPAKQTVTLPCFYFAPDHAIMPAFGEFTGWVRIKPKKGDQVFLIADSQLVKVNI